MAAARKSTTKKSSQLSQSTGKTKRKLTGSKPMKKPAGRTATRTSSRSP